MAKEIEIDGITYSVSKLPNAMKQMHIMRRILPVLSGAKGSAETAIKSVFDNIGTLKDDDFEYIVYGLLETAKRKDPATGLWTSISSGQSILFQDIDIMTILSIVKESALENFGFLGNGISLK